MADYIIPGVLAVGSFDGNNRHKMALVTDTAVIYLNRKHEFYKQNKKAFTKVCKMNTAQLLMLEKQAEQKKRAGMRTIPPIELAAGIELSRRNAKRYLCTNQEDPQ